LNCFASRADSLRPASAISEAICIPQVRTILGSPPAAAYTPTDVSGKPNVALGEATTMSLCQRQRVGRGEEARGNSTSSGISRILLPEHNH
jgi:hypothetical protein